MERVKLDLYKDRVDIFGWHIESREYVYMLSYGCVDSPEISPTSDQIVHAILGHMVEMLDLPVDVSDLEIDVCDKRKLQSIVVESNSYLH